MDYVSLIVAEHLAHDVLERLGNMSTGVVQFIDVRAFISVGAPERTHGSRGTTRLPPPPSKVYWWRVVWTSAQYPGPQDVRGAGGRRSRSGEDLRSSLLACFLIAHARPHYCQ